MLVRYAVLLLFLLCRPALPAQEIVRLEAADGQPLVGTYHAPTGAARGGVLLLHMYMSNRGAWRPLAPRLAASGFHVLSLDLRGHGKSTEDKAGKRIDISREVTKQPRQNPFLLMHQDARAGLDLLVQKGAPKERLAIVGASVGCSVALHAAKEYGKLVSAAVLLTPGTNYLGVPSLEHATSFGDRPVLILSSEEEADLGARPIQARIDSKKSELRILRERGIHGTRMLGRVDAIEADIIQWLQQAMVTTLSLKVPVTKDLFIDGAIEAEEGAGATVIEIPLETGKNAVVRISRNRKHLVMGFRVPERYVRRNAVVVFVHASGKVVPAVTEDSFKVSFSPSNPERRPILVWQGTNLGTWEESTHEDIQAHSQTRGKSEWSAEVALRLSRFLKTDGATTIRMAFQIDGQKPGQERYYPASANIKNSPRSWVAATVDNLK